jgi:hypothetical protein
MLPELVSVMLIGITNIAKNQSKNLPDQSPVMNGVQTEQQKARLV